MREMPTVGNCEVLISLLHATWFRSGGISDLHTLWIERSRRPEHVQIVVGLDSDDETALSQSEGLLRAVGAPNEDFSTAVRNWNAAARLADGELLFVISDDLEPFEGWDDALRAIARKLPVSEPWALNIGDTGVKPSLLLRHPIVNRAFYARHGLWNPIFSGVYCDHDLTYRAFFDSVIFSAEHLKFDHRSPTLHANLAPSRSQERANRLSEYQRGRDALESVWGKDILNVVPRNSSVSRIKAINFVKLGRRRFRHDPRLLSSE